MTQTTHRRVGLLSPFLKRRRLQAVQPWLKGHVLDFGCGYGGLAQYVTPDKYVGTDVDHQVLGVAEALYPDHLFLDLSAVPPEKFDTVVALAVIEHVPDPVIFLKELASKLRRSKGSSIVCTTPHPAFDSLYNFGAMLGIFSKTASEQHSQLLNRTELEKIAPKANLNLTHYERFLFGMNQLVVYEHER